MEQQESIFTIDRNASLGCGVSKSSYDKAYFDRNPSWHVEDSAWKANQVIKLLGRNRILDTVESFAEVGCGAGEILVQLRDRLSDDKSFVGYDISDAVTAMWREREGERLSFRQVDFLNDESEWDVLMLIDVVEHIEDYIGFLRRVRSRGKYKVFNFPLEIFAVKALLGRSYLDSRERYGHIHYFNREICLAFLAEQGYRIVDDFYAPSAIDLAATSTSVSPGSRLLKLPRIIISKFSVDLTAKLLGGYSLFILAE